MVTFIDNEKRRMAVDRPLLFGYYWCIQVDPDESTGKKHRWFYHRKAIITHWEGFVRLVTGLELFEKYLIKGNFRVALFADFVGLEKNPLAVINKKRVDELGSLGWVRVGKNNWVFEMPLGGGGDLRVALKKYLE